MTSSLKVIAVGNAFRGDDAVGLEVGALLRNRAVPGIEVCEATGEGTALMDLWRGERNVVIVDAVRSGGGSGAVRRIDALATSLPSDFFHYSTHAFSVAEAVELARVLGELPSSLIIYGVEGHNFDTGAPLSPGVTAAARHVADCIAAEGARMRRTRHLDTSGSSSFDMSDVTFRRDLKR